MNLRPFRSHNKDYAAHMRLVNLQYPDDPCSVAELRHTDETRPHDVWCRQFMVELNDEVVAYGAIGQAYWSHCPDQYFMQVDVDPACLGQGIGSMLFRRLSDMAQAENKVSTLTAECRDDRKEAVAFLKEKGFVVDIKNPSSLLDLAIFDEKPFLPRIEQVEGKGIHICNLLSLSQLSDWQERYWLLHETLLQDVPAPEPYRKRPLSLFVQHKIDSPLFAPDCTHMALSGATWVGMSELELDPEHPELGSTGMTGVSRDWRRMGIATTLKLAVLRVARERGIKRMITANEENNPMLQINYALGFKPLPTWLGWSLTFDNQN